MEKRGLSQVVTTLLFVLLALGAVLLVWNLVRGIIVEEGEGLDISLLTVNLEIVSADNDIDGKSVSVLVKRNAGDGNIEGLKIILEDIDGNSISRDVNLVIEELEIKRVSVDYSGENIGEIVSVSIAPVLLFSSGKEVVGSTTSKYSFVDGVGGIGEIIPLGCDLTQTPGLYALFDARDGSYVSTTGNVIGSWDSVDWGQTDYLGMTLSGDPVITYNTNGLNGLPEVEFQNEWSMLTPDSNWFPMPVDGAEWTMIAVVDLDLDYTVPGLMFDGGFGYFGAPDGYFRIWLDPFFDKYDMDVGGQSFSVPISEDPHVLVMRYDGVTEFKVWINGGIPETTQSVTDPTGIDKKMNLGIDFDVSTAKYDMSMVMISFDSLEVSELDDVMGCVEEIWGINAGPVSL